MKYLDGRETYGEVTQRFENIVSNVLHEEDKPMKKMRFQPVAILLIVVLLCGVGYATINWGVREATTRTNYGGDVVQNDEFLAYTQVIDETFESDALKIDIIDAVYDGSSFVVSWTATNKLRDSHIYIHVDALESGIPWDEGEMSKRGDDVLIPGDGTVVGSINSRIYSAPENDPIPVGMRFTVLEPTVGIVYSDDVNEIGNNLVLQRSGDYGYLMSDDWFQEMDKQAQILGYDKTDIDLMVSTGKFSLMETLDVSFEMENTNVKKSLLPGGHTIERAYDAFTISIPSAIQTPDSIIVTVDVLFKTEENALRYSGFAPGSYSIGFEVFNDTGDNVWAMDSNSSGPIVHEPFQNEDDSWVIQYEIVYRGLSQLPRSITIVPKCTDSQISIEQEDGITIDIK